MTNTKDYISARTQCAEERFPILKEELEQLIDKPETKKDFISDGEIRLSKVLCSDIAEFRSQSEELFDQLSDWLKEFGWCLIYKSDDKNLLEKYLIGRPFYQDLYLVPEEYVHN